MVFDTNLMYDFSIDYSNEDIEALLDSFEITGFLDDFHTKRMVVGDFYSDYLQKRVNPFSYLSGISSIDARTLMELRKSSLPRLPIEFYQNHPEPSDGWREIKRYRAEFLSQFFEDYQDENWQYWWVLRLTIFNKGRESLSFVYEDYLVDGDPEKDYFQDPIEVLAHKLVYGGPKPEGAWIV